MAKPPKTIKKLGIEAQQERGEARECNACGEYKTISERTYALSNKGLRGWHLTCRVCQGVASAEKVENLSIPARIDKRINDTNLISEMYRLFQSNRELPKVDRIAAELGERIRTTAVTDRRAAFELFIEVVKPMVPGWMEPGEIHGDIKDGLLSEHKRCLIIATRYSAKSTLTGIFVAFEIFLDPLIKIMVISRGQKLAARMLRTVRRVILANCPMLTHLVPVTDCLDNAEQFQTPHTLTVVTGGATLTSLGMGSNLPGFRSDLTIGDDVEGPQDNTPEKVQQLEEDLNELHMINPKGRKVMLGTYQSEFSVYAKLADLEDSDGTSIWEHHRACMFEEDRLDGKEVIHSRWAEMFSDSQALDWRRSVTERAWKLHAMLIADPSILHERPLKISDLPVLENINPKGTAFPLLISRTTERPNDLTTWSAPKGDVWYKANPSRDTGPLASIVMAVDPASGLAGRDAIGVAVLGITQGGLGIILHLEGVRAADKTTARRRVARIGSDYRATIVLVEELADGLFGETLESDFILIDYPISIQKVTTGGQQKGRRIVESLGPPMGAGRLCILDSVARGDHGGEFVNQLVRISYDGRTGAAKDHDDIVDALAHAVAASKASLVGDIADNVAAYRVDKLDRWKNIPMRNGGLGSFEDDEFAHTSRFDFNDGQMSMADALLEEDQVMISLVERRARLQSAVAEDIQAGRGADQRTVDNIKVITRQVDELRQLDVF